MKFCGHIFLAFVFSLFFSVGFAQDLILKKDGTKIYCRIVDEDSVSIFFIRSAQKNRSVINRSEVETYFATKRRKHTSSASTDSSGKKELVLVFLNGGLAAPLGMFANKDTYDTTISPGYANSGYLFNANAVLRLKDFFGISLGYRHQQHSFDDKVWAEADSRVSPAGSVFSSHSGNWLIRGAFVGVYFGIPATTLPNLSVDFMFSGGLPRYLCPEVVVTRELNGQTTARVSNEAKSRGYGISGNIGAHYNLGRNMGLNLSFGFFGGQATFTNVLTKSNNGFIVYSDFVQKFSSFNVEAGLIIRMYK